MINIEFVEILAGQDGFFNYPSGICHDAREGIFYIADMHNHRVCWLSCQNRRKGVLPNAVNGVEGDKRLDRPLAVSVSDNGNLYAADAGNNCVYRKSKNKNEWDTVIKAYKDASPPEMNLPGGVTVDREENIYISDFLNNRICSVDNSGVASVFEELSQGIHKPYGIFHRLEKIYITDTGNSAIRYYDLVQKKVFTLQLRRNDDEYSVVTVGEQNCEDKSKEKGFEPIALTADQEGNLYICEKRSILYLDMETKKLEPLLSKDIWEKVSKKFHINERICHIGSIVVPEKGNLYWVDTIKGLLYHINFNVKI